MFNYVDDVMTWSKSRPDLRAINENNKDNESYNWVLTKIISEASAFMALQKLAGVFSSGTSSTSPPSPQKSSFVSAYISRFSGDQKAIYEGQINAHGK